MQTCLPKGVVTTPSLDILVLEDRYESPLSTDTKNLPVAIHLMSQWHQRHKKLDFTNF